MTDQQLSPADERTSAAHQQPSPSHQHPSRAHQQLRRRRVVVGSTAIVFFGIVLVITGGTRSPLLSLLPGTSDSSAGGPAKVLRATGAIGQSVRDGSFAFVVTYAKPPLKTVKDRSGAVQIAEGQFVIVGVDVTNIGYEPRTLSATDQFVANLQGQRFATSSATSSLKGIPQEKLNPGHTATGVPLLFDLPFGAAVTSIELHDSLSSPGVKVKL
jgi:hypothetical protein